MDKVQIGLLTYKHFSVLVKKTLEKLLDPSIEIILIEGTMDNILEKVQNAYKYGVEVFVGSGANAKTVNTLSDVPFVQLQLSTFDYLEALLKAKEYGTSATIVMYQQSTLSNLEKLQKLSGLNIHQLIFYNKTDLMEKLANITSSTIIGGSLSNEIAKHFGLKSIMLYPGENVVLNALTEAKKIALTLRREKEKSKINQTILDFTLNGVIAVNNDGTIIMFNAAASKILQKAVEQVVGHYVWDVFPDLFSISDMKHKQPIIGEVKTVNNLEIMLNIAPVENKNGITGYIIIFQKITDIQKMEQKIRVLNKQKGLTAKAVFTDIIGNSKQIQDVIYQAKLYAQTNSNILIHGNTGVGKELLAQSIHNYSHKQSGPFVAVNCASLPESLLESELFGYEGGAFTGSKLEGRPGLFEMAHDGTIFLDEICEISLTTQAHLLRVLQEKEVRRIGGDRIIPIDVRVIAATNKSLKDIIPSHFREDLYYRLNVLQINIPPLSQRIEDIVPLFLHFLNNGIPVQQYEYILNDDTLSILKSYSWPGNIRELQNVAERFIILFKNCVNCSEITIREMLINAIGLDELFDDILIKYNYTPAKGQNNKKSLIPLIEYLESIFPGKKNTIAHKLGISRTSLWRIMKK